jgi:hypothetical protein
MILKLKVINNGEVFLMNWYDFMINAAKDSRYKANPWFRYLREVIFENYTYLTDEDIENLLNSTELTAFQKVTLKCAVQIGSPTHAHVVSLNNSANVEEVRKLREG